MCSWSHSLTYSHLPRLTYIDSTACTLVPDHSNADRSDAHPQVRESQCHIGIDAPRHPAGRDAIRKDGLAYFREYHLRAVLKNPLPRNPLHACLSHERWARDPIRARRMGSLPLLEKEREEGQPHGWTPSDQGRCDGPNVLHSTFRFRASMIQS